MIGVWVCNLFVRCSTKLRVAGPTGLWYPDYGNEGKSKGLGLREGGSGCARLEEGESTHVPTPRDVLHIHGAGVRGRAFGNAAIPMAPRHADQFAIDRKSSRRTGCKISWLSMDIPGFAHGMYRQWSVTPLIPIQTFIMASNLLSSLIKNRLK